MADTLDAYYRNCQIFDHTSDIFTDKWLNITSRIVHKMYDIVDEEDSQDVLYSEVIQGASLLMAWAEHIRKRNLKKEQNGQ